MFYVTLRPVLLLVLLAIPFQPLEAQTRDTKGEWKRGNVKNSPPRG